jgi:hypothetical protein
MSPVVPEVSPVVPSEVVPVVVVVGSPVVVPEAEVVVSEPVVAVAVASLVTLVPVADAEPLPLVSELALVPADVEFEVEAESVADSEVVSAPSVPPTSSPDPEHARRGARVATAARRRVRRGIGDPLRMRSERSRARFCAAERYQRRPRTASRLRPLEPSIRAVSAPARRPARGVLKPATPSRGRAAT